ncbi:putative Late nodulin [Medicago truncatula]|uniref:Nodule Cysteine-Rich (NCR) secreted peptide n=1 Tax=Medicago truncatula TaxID=3880 RepID=A0A072UE21_MEDTR|nr:Nodule Cysteine-Rich (NCR) secreted peptide [Medicago truncatula]RHN55980.1 putative Late nodulin [Medicago truncatula]
MDKTLKFIYAMFSCLYLFMVTKEVYAKSICKVDDDCPQRFVMYPLMFMCIKNICRLVNE